MANETRDLSALIRQIQALSIDVSKNEEGVFTVCSTAEPFFCYDADSLEDAQILVGQTLASYAKQFYHLDGLSIPIEETLLSSAHLTVERGTPVARLKPVFDLAA